MIESGSGARSAGDRRWGARAGLVFVTAALALGAVPAIAPAQTDALSEQTSFLAVVDAGKGSYDADEGSLTLDDVNNRAIWFTDRPERATGQYSIAEMTEFFFTDQLAPNAALELQAKDQRGDITVVEVSNPKYDLAKDRLTFDTKILDDPATQLQRPDSALTHLVKRHVGKIPKSFGASTLFIDDASGPSDASGQPDGDVQVEGDVGGVTYTGQLTANNLSYGFETDCTQVKNPADNGAFNFVQRKPGDDPTITDDARVDVQIDSNAQVNWVRGNSAEWQHIGSRLATSIKVTAAIWDKSDLTANYKITVWCAQQPEDAWVVFG